jgi:uncharacterized protein (TIGR03435 family)
MRPACAIVIFALAVSAQTFEVASIKPNTSGERFGHLRLPSGGSFSATNTTLKSLVVLAYHVKDFAISGGPSWVDSDRFDVAAKLGDPQTSEDDFRLMLRNLLAERLHLAVHRETRVVPIYTLLPGKNGMHLPGAKPEGCGIYGQKSSQSLPPCGAFGMDSGETTRLEGKQVSMAALVSGISSVLGRPVVDETNYSGTFDVRLEFAESAAAPSIFTALQDELGLRLEARKGPSEILVIDHAERPNEN